MAVGSGHFSGGRDIGTNGLEGGDVGAAEKAAVGVSAQDDLAAGRVAERGVVVERGEATRERWGDEPGGKEHQVLEGEERVRRRLRRRAHRSDYSC